MMHCKSDDFYDAMMNRGEFLRKLRLMEQEDEASREICTDEYKGNDILIYEEFLSSQNFYDDYKHVNYSLIDFGNVGDGPLIVAQDRTVGKGGFVWDAGFILAEHVVNEMEWQVGKPKIVELGSGTGVTGLFVARNVKEATVHLTDLPALQPLLEKNACACPENVTTGVLEWGRHASGQFDVILGADVVASIYDSFALAKTIYDLSHEKSRIYLACRDRLAGNIDAFESHMKDMFDHVEKKPSNSRNKSPNVYIFTAHGKREQQ